MGDAANVPAIRRHCRSAGARATGAGTRITAGTGGETCPFQTAHAQPRRMSMDFDKDDLAALCAGLTTDEVSRVHRLLHEWSVGPDSSFPVQLALLTKTQWRAAALIPRTIKDSGKMIELHLAECRPQTAAIVKNLSTVAENNAVELKNIVKAHAETVQQASVDMRNRLWESE